MTYYIGVLVGCILFLLFQLNKAYKKPEFAWGIFFKSIWIPGLINLVIGFALVFAREDVSLAYPITFITAMALGIAGQAILKGIFESSNKDIPTVIGVGD